MGGGGGGWRGGGEGDYIPIAIHCHHQNDSCIKMDSDDSPLRNAEVILVVTVQRWVYNLPLRLPPYTGGRDSSVVRAPDS